MSTHPSAGRYAAFLTALRFRATGLRAGLRRGGDGFNGTASISLADAPDSPRARADLTNAPASTPSSKASPALSRG